MKLLFITIFICLTYLCQASKDTSRHHNVIMCKEIYTSNDIGFMDSNSTSEYMYHSDAEVDIMTSENKIYLRVNNVDGTFIFYKKETKQVDGENVQVFYVKDKDVSMIIINSENDVFFIRKNGEKLIINKCSLESR